MFRVLRNYFFWTYERGSFHYDVMVTLILAFLFLSPRFIDYKDKPKEPTPLQTSQMLVTNIDGVHFIYQVPAATLDGLVSEDQKRTAILGVIEPIAGEVTIDRYVPVVDGRRNVIAYKVWVRR
ncbi:MAG: hypothetical protein ACYC46_11895 [Acidobacteriaceae bacterium]